MVSAWHTNDGTTENSGFKKDQGWSIFPPKYKGVDRGPPLVLSELHKMSN